MTLALNLLLGVLPAIILGASWAAGTEDTRQHRIMFLFVFGLWALTLAMWNWMRSTGWWWVGGWATVGVIALVIWTVGRRRP